MMMIAKTSPDWGVNFWPVAMPGIWQNTEAIECLPESEIFTYGHLKTRNNNGTVESPIRILIRLGRNSPKPPGVGTFSSQWTAPFHVLHALKSGLTILALWNAHQITNKNVTQTYNTPRYWLLHEGPWTWQGPVPCTYGFPVKHPERRNRDSYPLVTSQNPNLNSYK